MSKASRIVFHVYLTISLFAATVGVLYFLLMRNDFLTQNPDIEPLYAQYIVATLMSGVGALALLKSRKWGFWAMMLGFMGVFGIEIMANLPLDRILRIPAAALLLWLLMRWNKLL